MNSLIHKKEQPYFILSLIISIPLYGLLFFSGIGILLLAFLIFTPLFAHWIMLGHIRTNGVKITPSQFSDIYEAAADRDYEKLDKLYKEGYDVNVQDEYGWNTLHYAASSDIYSEEELMNLVQRLLEMGVDPNVRDTDDFLPADIAEDMGYPKTADILQNAARKQNNL